MKDRILRRNAFLHGCNEVVPKFALDLACRGWNLFAFKDTAEKISSDNPGKILGVCDITGKITPLDLGAILAASGGEDGITVFRRRNLPWLDLVYVDASALEKTEKRKMLILLWAAARGSRIVIFDRVGCQAVLDWFSNGRPDEKKFRRRLAVEVETLMVAHSSFFGENFRRG